MAITAALVKELRERTGAGMMDCKKMLTETGGDMDAAIEELRKKGAAAAEKKAGRIAAEGVIASANSGNQGVLVEVNCETDFVAKDTSFTNFSNEVAEAALAGGFSDVENLAAAQLANGSSVAEALQELTTKIGEKISLRRISSLGGDSSIVSTYLHGNRIGVMVQLGGGDDTLGRDLAMHIAASRPLCVSEDEMDADVLEKEKQIFMAQAAESGKPADIIEKMIGGRMKKFLKENTLLGQPFVKNPDQTVADLLKSKGARVEKMIRFEVGEGMEKRSDDFVAEVMAQAGN
ncbi:MAG: translation elongation factor Ts [Pseudomonadota bacterium]